MIDFAIEFNQVNWVDNSSSFTHTKKKTWFIQKLTIKTLKKKQKKKTLKFEKGTHTKKKYRDYLT